MAVEVLVQGLWILEVAGVGVGSVEAAVGGVVVSGPEVVLLEVVVVLLAGVEVVCRRGACCGRVAAQEHAVGVIVVVVGRGDAARGIGQLPRAAVAVVEEVLRLADLINLSKSKTFLVRGLRRNCQKGIAYLYFTYTHR